MATSRPCPLLIAPHLGKWGLRELVEPRLRSLVADHLGVPTAELCPEVSLTDELAADSLDMLEMALAIEGAFSVTVPERILETIRTYGELVEATSTLVAGVSAPPGGEPAPPPVVWATIARAGTAAEVALQRAEPLTPYHAETIGEDAVHAGHGARLDLVAPPDTSDGGLAAIHDRFAWLAGRGVELSVRRQSTPGAPPAEGRREEYAAL